MNENKWNRISVTMCVYMVFTRCLLTLTRNNGDNTLTAWLIVMRYDMPKSKVVNLVPSAFNKLTRWSTNVNLRMRKPNTLRCILGTDSLIARTLVCIPYLRINFGRFCVDRGFIILGGQHSCARCQTGIDIDWGRSHAGIHMDLGWGTDWYEWSLGFVYQGFAFHHGLEPVIHTHGKKA